MTAIPLADAGEFAGLARRTLVTRATLAVLVVAAMLGAVLAARNPGSQTIVAVPSHADTIVVLDLSASIGSDTFSRIGATLSALARSKGRYGLVVFSGQAYEALPPGVPAQDLAPLVRYFMPQKSAGAGFAPMYPRNPWADTFSAGTQISAGLELAHTIAARNGLRRPAVVLVSDLDDDPADLQRAASIVLAYRRDRIPLRIVGLNPSPENAAFFQRLVGSSSPIVQAGAATPGPQPRNRTPFPTALVILATVAAVLLALHELWAARLDWEPVQ